MPARPHMRKVYDSAAWKRVRLQVLERDGWQCIAAVWDARAEMHVRCPTRDRRVGGTESLTVDHQNEHAHPLDPNYLRTLCHYHHGKSDGPRAKGGRKR